MHGSVESSSGDFVQSLARGLAVIRAFDADDPSLSLSEVAKQAEISPASARRLLRTLETLGYVRTSGRQFSLTPQVLELGFSYLASLRLPEVVTPHLQRLSAKLGESVSVAVLDDIDVVYVARVETRRIMRVNITVGTRFPAYATSMGQVLLAALPESQSFQHLPARLELFTPMTLTSRTALGERLERVRIQGWCMVDGELELGLRSLAVPLRGSGDDVVAAMNISSNASSSSTGDILSGYLPQALSTADDIARDLRLLV